MIHQTFKTGPHLLYQDVFKAESADWRIHVGYDDVEGGNTLWVTFKHRWDAEGQNKQVMMECGSAKKAVERALRFIAQHPVAEPYCMVDY